MSEKTFAISSLTAILDQARAEAKRLKDAAEKAATKAANAENRVKTLEDTIAQLSGGTVGKSQKDMILDIINEHDGEGLTAKEIQANLEAAGFKIASNNPTASIHVAAEQLQKDQLIEVISHPGGKIFKRKIT